MRNENYEQIYTSRSSLKTTHARKYIENKIAQYTEEGTLEQRRMIQAYSDVSWEDYTGWTYILCIPAERCSVSSGSD